MGIDNIAVIEAEGARIVGALEASPTGRVPWSDDWTVATVAQHVGGVHHVVAKVIEDRPEGDFGLFRSIQRPGLDDPGLGTWAADGTAALAAQLRATDPAAECWSWWPEGTNAAFWQRRMAQETLVHRWDAELGAGITGARMAPDVAADGIDEYLDVFVAVSRLLNTAPAGPPIHLHCTDTEGEWLLELPAGERVLTREHRKGDVALRGAAEDLLLVVWGRKTPAEAGVDVVGDATVLDRWSELVPPM
jgi:uncharacterized protein (TIGR03083 family)